MAEQTIVSSDGLPLLKAVEYRAAYTISSSSKAVNIRKEPYETNPYFKDKNDNAYSQTLPGGYNVIGFCSVNSGSQYLSISQVDLTGTSSYLMRLYDVRDASTTGSATASIIVLYLRADVVS